MISLLKSIGSFSLIAGAALAMTSCGTKTHNASAEGAVYGPDGKPISFVDGVPVSTKSNTHIPSEVSSGGGGGGH